MSRPILGCSSPILVLAARDIDTDQIIPARYLTTTGRHGLGKHAFTDFRRDAGGGLDPDCALNDPRARACQILVVGENFGCGSSREHAPCALLDMGIRAVISSSIADIFRSNALKNGLLAVEIDARTHQVLLGAPWQDLSIDLETSMLTLPDGSEQPFAVDGFARSCLLNGVDELGFLLTREDAIARYEQRLARE